MRPAVIEGLLREGETAGIHAQSKLGKSWLEYGLAIAIASGSDWLGKFKCSQGRVLLIDNELHPETLAYRFPHVGRALGLNDDDWMPNVDVASVRGNLLDINQLKELLVKLEHPYKVILLDAMYRFLPEGTSENDNAQITRVMNTIDHYAQLTGAAIMFIHHTSKGGQADKAITDVGSGAGALSRAVDTHVAIREHEESGCAVMDAALRSWRGIDPVVLRWEFPLWKVDDQLDPSQLKRTKTPGQIASEQKDAKGKETLLKHLDCLTNVSRLAKATGMGKARIAKLVNQLPSRRDIELRSPVMAGMRSRIVTGLVLLTGRVLRGATSGLVTGRDPVAGEIPRQTSRAGSGGGHGADGSTGSGVTTGLRGGCRGGQNWTNRIFKCCLGGFFATTHIAQKRPKTPEKCQ